MTDIMTLGGNSLRSYGRGIATVGDNIGNAQTPGYARRTVDMENGAVIRYADDWRESEARISSGLASQAAVRLDWLTAAETALNDGEGGVGSRLGNVFNAANGLASDPRNTMRRAAFLQSIDDAALAFRTTASGLKAASDGVAAQAVQTIGALNTQLSVLRDINRTVLATPAGTTSHAALLDQRDQILADIAGSVAVDVSLSTKGIASVRLSGTGEPLADAMASGSFGMSQLADGRLSFSVADSDGATAGFSPLAGSLAGLGGAAADLADKRSELDALAARFVDFLNDAQANGMRDDGSPGADSVSLGAQGALTIAALDIGPAGLALSDGSTDNGHLLSVINSRSNSGVEAGWVGLVADQAQRVLSARLLHDTSRARSDAAFEARDEMSGVNLDHEAVELLRFQQSFDAAARVLQAAREMLQSILNIVR